MNLAKIFVRFEITMNLWKFLKILLHFLHHIKNADLQRAINKFDLSVNLQYKSLRGRVQ